MNWQDDYDQPLQVIKLSLKDLFGDFFDDFDLHPHKAYYLSIDNLRRWIKVTMEEDDGDDDFPDSDQDDSDDESMATSDTSMPTSEDDRKPTVGGSDDEPETLAVPMQAPEPEPVQPQIPQPVRTPQPAAPVRTPQPPNGTEPVRPPPPERKEPDHAKGQ